MASKSVIVVLEVELFSLAKEQQGLDAPFETILSNSTVLNSISSNLDFWTKALIALASQNKKILLINEGGLRVVVNTD